MKSLQALQKSSLRRTEDDGERAEREARGAA